MADVISVSGYEDGSDVLGFFARVSVDPSVFSEEAIIKTAYWFTDHYYLFIARNASTNMIEVEFRLKEGDESGNLKVACGEFHNSLLE